MITFLKQILVRLFLLLALMMSAGIPVIVAQDNDSTRQTGDLPTDPPRRFNLVFTRGFALAGPANDTVPISSTASGSYAIGAGFLFPFGPRNRVGLRAAPGLSWTSFTYQQLPDKTFPTVSDSVNYDQERHRLFFLEMPIGLYVNFTRDEDGDPLFFGEMGGYIGYLGSAQYKIKYRNSAGQRVMQRTRDLEQLSDPGEFERIRYGAYARVGYKWFSLFFSMRLTPVFDEFTNPSLRPKNVEGFRNPGMPAMEIGLSLFL